MSLLLTYVTVMLLRSRNCYYVKFITENVCTRVSGNAAHTNLLLWQHIQVETF